MSKNARKDSPTQKTPKGYKIPVPTRGDVMHVLERAAQTVKPSTPSRRAKKNRLKE